MSIQLQRQERGTYLTRVACKGVWLLPAFGLLLAFSTIRQQPPVQTDFEGYARFVTTGEFLVSHLVASIGGAALAILGVCSVFVLLAGGRFRRAALIGTIITVIAQVYLASAFGSAAFVQPGIGRAYLRGETAAAQALNADTAYGPAFMATAGFAVLFWLIGTVFLVVALVRTSPRLRAPGLMAVVRVHDLPEPGWQRLACDAPLECSDISVVLALPRRSQPTVCAIRETVQRHTTARHR